MKCSAPLKLGRASRRRRGLLMVDVAVGMAILTLAIVPLAWPLVRETRLLRAEYDRGAMMEVVDGQMEILAAGAWRDFPDGTQPYTVQANVLTNLPPGHFELTKNGRHLRLQWKPDHADGVGTMTRQFTVP